MKTSNILFTALVATGFLMLTTFFVQFRLSSRHQNSNQDISDDSTPTETIELPEFSHISVTNMKSLDLKSTNADTKIEGFSELKNGISGLTYSITNDTLTLSISDTLKMRNGFRLMCSAKLKSIAANNSEVQISNFTSDSLSMTITKSGVHSDSRGNHFDYLNVAATADSKVQWRTGEITDLSISLADESQGVFQVPIRSADVILSSSIMVMTTVDKLQMENKGDGKLRFLD